MRDRFNQVAGRATDTFKAFTPGQKMVTLLAVAALVVGGFMFSSWAGKASYAPLFSNLSAGDASAIVEQLNAGGTPYELADGGRTVLVPQEQVYDLRLQMSGEGLPAEDDTGYALLDKQGITTSEFMQHVGYQRALEGELARTITSIEGIRSATVHLAIPQKTVFADDEQQPTAAIMVVTGTGTNLGYGQVQSIVHLVASSVEGLAPEKVTVTDSTGAVLAADGDSQTLGAAGDQRTAQTMQYEERLSSAVQRMLDQVVGAGRSVVKVTADLDYDQTETRTEQYTADPDLPPLAETTNTETYTGTGGAPAGGVLGPDNIQVPAGAGGGEYERTSETRNNALGVVTETRRLAPGQVRGLSVAVLLDSTMAAGVDQAELQQLVSSAVGLDADRGDGITLSAMPFDQSAAERTQQEAAAILATEQREQLIGMAKDAGIVLAVVLLLLLTALSRRRRNKRRLELTKAEMAQLELMQAELEQARSRMAVEAAGAEPAHAITAQLPADPDREQRESRQQEITGLVERQPEEVAQLLRSWLADRRVASR
jgi:flagellar M-ring protein FliF